MLLHLLISYHYQLLS